MKKKNIILTRGLLAEKGVCDLGLYDFKKWYPYGSASISTVLRKLQELANTTPDYLKYVDYAIWLIRRFPPTQETLVLKESTEKVIFWNGDINIKAGIDGERFIIGNGDLNIEGDVNVTGDAKIWAERVKAINIAAKDYAKICAGETIDAQNIATKNYAVIRAGKTIDTINIAAKGHSGIWAKKINVQNIIDDYRVRIHGDINLINPPQTNPQYTNTASNLAGIFITGNKDRYHEENRHCLVTGTPC